jgi:hypothetical protein
VLHGAGWLSNARWLRVSLQKHSPFHDYRAALSATYAGNAVLTFWLPVMEANYCFAGRGISKV